MGRRSEPARRRLGVSCAVLSLAACALALRASPAAAHEAIGIPYFAYDEADADVLLLRLDQVVDRWSFDLTGRPGKPSPGEATELVVRIAPLTGDDVLDVPMTLSVIRVSAMGTRETVDGPHVVKASDDAFTFHPTFPTADNYEVLLAFQDGADEHSLRYAYVVGEPGSPWLVLGFALAAFAGLAVFVRLAKSRKARAAGVSATPSLEATAP